MIRSETNEKMDLEGHYPQNTISHCIISNETQITLHFFQGRISAMPKIRVDLLAISKTGMCLFTSSFLNVLLVWFPAGKGLKKVVNPITVGNFAFLFNCTPVGRTSDSMMVPT